MGKVGERARSARAAAGHDVVSGGADLRDALSDPLGRAELGSDSLVGDPLAGGSLDGIVQAFGELSEPMPSPSGGDPLPDSVRDPMESSFGTSFSSVRVHNDGAAGATAFARGEHLHFAPGKFDAGSESGRTVIGHELTHVMQQRAGRVSADSTLGFDFPVNQSPALEAEADALGAQAARGQRVNVPGAAAGIAAANGPAQGWDWPWAKKKKAEGGDPVVPAVDPSKPEAQVDAGPNQRQESGSFGVDLLKKGVIVGAGASFKGVDPLADAAKSGGMQGYGGAIGGNVLAGGGFLAATMGLKSGYQREKDAERTSDKGGVELGKSQQKDSAQGMVQTGLGVAQTGVDIATVSKHGTTAVMSNAKTASDLASAGGNALSVAGAALGIAGNAVAFCQAVYEGAGAISRWRRLNAKSVPITPRGKVWEDRVRNRTKWKTALQGVKMAAAALGIVAGALALVSNPVGWAIGIAAAATLGVMAIGKLIGGLWRKRQQNKAEAELKKKGGDPAKPENVGQELQQEVEGAGAGEAGPQGKKKDGKQSDDEKRKEVKKRADEAATMVSTNAKVAAEMASSIRQGFLEPRVLLDKHNAGDSTPIYEYTDALGLIEVIGLSEAQVASPSGQELIEQKISAVNGL